MAEADLGRPGDDGRGRLRNAAYPFIFRSRSRNAPARPELMSTLKLFGMRAAYDEVMATGIKRRHEPPRIVGDLLNAEIAEKKARSIKYQLTIAKLPLAKDIDEFDFTGTPINEALVRDLASGRFIAEQRNAVLIGGTGTGKSHLAMASREPASALAREAASTPSSTSSTGSKARPAPAARGGSPTT